MQKGLHKGAKNTIKALRALGRRFIFLHKYRYFLSGKTEKKFLHPK